jgi:hypothetical protein
MSLIAVMSEESKEEIKKTIHSKNMYIGIDGKMVFSGDNDIIRTVLKNMTGV